MNECVECNFTYNFLPTECFACGSRVVTQEEMREIRESKLLDNLEEEV